jgi:membrane associated rhomboid family serine protease
MAMAYRRYGGFNLGPVTFLILANVIFFVATLIRPEFIVQFGLKPATFTVEPWTIITAMFIHANFGHILGNMFTLYFFGTFLVQLVGDGNFFLIYFLGGLAGNGLYLLLAPQYSIAVGASGAIFAVGGALAVMRPKLTVFVFPIPAPIPLWLAVLGGFLITTLVSGIAAIAWQAHLGGLVFGLLAGLFFRRRERGRFISSHRW